MPILPWTDNELDPMHIKAVMLYPRDGVARRVYCDLTLIEYELANRTDTDTIQIRAGLLIKVLTGEDPRAKPTLIERTKRGIVAGNLLRIMYLMHTFGPKCLDLGKPSLHKAIHVCKVWADKYQFGDGSSIPISDKKIRDCWYEFAPSAHLWAAQQLNRDIPYVERDEFFASAENVRTFLGVAAGAYNFATAYVPKGSPTKTPLMDPEEAWGIPESINALVPPSDGAFPEALAAVTRQYRATSSKKPSR